MTQSDLTNYSRAVVPSEFTNVMQVYKVEANATIEPDPGFFKNGLTSIDT